MSTARKSQRLPNAGALSAPAWPGQALNRSQAEGTERDRERAREREREREGKREKQQEGGGALLLGDGEASPSRSLVGAASREENESRRTKALLTDSEGLERATALGQKY